MCSIFDSTVDCSSDENDGDYVPPGGVIACDSSGKDNASFDEDSEPDQKTKSRKVKSETKKNEKPESEVAPCVDQKKRAENVWYDFLFDMSESTLYAKKPVATECKEISTTSDINSEKPNPFTSELVSGSKSEDLEFAGETLPVSDESVQSPLTDVKVDSAEKLSASSGAVPKKRPSIESLLSSISNKKKKLSTLEKTRFDWNSFKKTEGLQEDLEKYNKGKGGFIERQRFLERSDLRSFEIEKSLRQSEKKM